MLTARRFTRLTGFASTQLVVQAIGFASGIVLVRHMAEDQYGYYTLALSLAGVAGLLMDLGLATAVLAQGGRRLGDRVALGGLVADADAVRRRLVGVSLVVLVPVFVAVLLHQHASGWQAAAITLLTAAAAVLNVRTGIALSIARLFGQVGVQQRLDLALGAAKLALLAAAATIALDATFACVVNLVFALAYAQAMSRHAKGQIVVPETPPGDSREALWRHVSRQAPNSIYYALSTQVGVWLVSVFGSTQHVAEVGALGRIGALFAVVVASTAAFAMPYFARHESPAALVAGFASINAFFALLLAALLAFAAAFPEAVLWLLGDAYAHLHDELLWMVAAATLSTWGGTLYSVASARGWVVPVGIAATSSIVATAAAASLVDVSTVRGSLAVSCATALVALVVSFAYLAQRLRVHGRAAVLPR